MYCCWLLVGLLWGCHSANEMPPISAARPAPDPFAYLFQPLDTTLSSDVLTPAEQHQLQVGDVLLRKGFGGYSAYIAAVLEEAHPVTHCGWVVPAETGSWAILHAASTDQQSGIYTEPLDDYLRQSQAGSLVLVRPRCTPAQLKVALAYAQQKMTEGIPFDAAFDDHDASALYCAELVRDALRHATGEDWLPRRCHRPPRDVLRLDNFFDPQRFEVVWNHWDTLPAHRLPL